MDILQAAKQLTGVNWNLRGDQLEQAVEEGVLPVATPSLEDLQALMQTETYKDQRRPLYPQFADLADALVHQANGDNQHYLDYIAACNAVKAQFPKP